MPPGQTYFKSSTVAKNGKMDTKTTIPKWSAIFVRTPCIRNSIPAAEENRVQWRRNAAGRHSVTECVMLRRRRLRQTTSANRPILVMVAYEAVAGWRQFPTSMYLTCCFVRKTWFSWCFATKQARRVCWIEQPWCFFLGCFFTCARM